MSANPGKSPAQSAYLASRIYEEGIFFQSLFSPIRGWPRLAEILGLRGCPLKKVVAHLRVQPDWVMHHPQGDSRPRGSVSIHAGYTIPAT
jgi:hypothetical protein